MKKEKSKLDRVLYLLIVASIVGCAVCGVVWIWWGDPLEILGSIMGTCGVIVLTCALLRSMTSYIAPEKADAAQRSS